MAAVARADGQDKVLATAQRIVKSLATSKNAAEDMIRILSGFDHRLSTMTGLFPSSSSSGCFFPAAVTGSRILDAAEKVIRRWESSDSLLWDSSEEETFHYLDAVDELISLLESGSSAKELLARAEVALQIAMGRLEDEFIHLMSRIIAPLDITGPMACTEYIVGSEEEGYHNQLDIPKEPGQSSISDCLKIDFVLPEVVSDVKEIADRMVRAGYEKELCQVYSSIRRDVLGNYLSILGFESVSIEEVQRTEWRDLDGKMKKWIQALKAMVKVLLMEEKRLCEQIFSSSEELFEECFTAAAKGCILQILNFGDAITICQRSPEKIFRILDMHEALADVIPELQSLFSGEAQALLCGESEGILKRLGDAVRGTFMGIVSSVQKDVSRKPPPDGDVHPLTRHVMNYVKLFVEHSSSLDLLLGCEDFPRELKEDDDQFTGERAPSAQWMLLIISYLESNIEMKSKNYEDGGLQCIFLMNNMLYIVQQVKESKLLIVLGDRWVRKRRGKVKQHATSYLRASWSKILTCLKDDGLGRGRGGIFNTSSKMAIKERFKNFNTGFEEIYRNQIAWKVSDPQLREELRISISEKVIPAYRSFFGRFGGQLEDARYAAKYIKHTPDELEDCLSDFFEGLPGLSNHLIRRRLSSHRTLPSHR